MFKALTDNGKTFGEKMNLSNSANSNSQDAQIAASSAHVQIVVRPAVQYKSLQPMVQLVLLVKDNIIYVFFE
jgi:hypothetical protein